jgi:hypothetical protein
VLNAVGVLLHNWLVFGQFSIGEAALVTTVLVGYAVGAWAVWPGDGTARGVDLGDLFLP